MCVWFDLIDNVKIKNAVLTGFVPWQKQRARNAAPPEKNRQQRLALVHQQSTDYNI